MEEDIKIKQCSKCKEFKTIKCFHKNSKSKDGLYNSCKSCNYEFKKLISDRKLAENMTYEEKIIFFEEQKKIIERRKKFIDLDSNCNEGNKVCTICLEKYPATIEFFNQDKHIKSGLDSMCKKCTSKVIKERRLIKIEKNKNNIYIYTVYAHINKKNGKIYIGTTKRDVRDRWRKGKRYEQNEEFYSDILKYGWDEGFNHEIIASNLTEEEGYSFEKLLVKKLDTVNTGYNQVEGGKNAKPTEKTKLKISNKNKGRSSITKGRAMPEETKRKLSEAKKGKHTGADNYISKPVYCGGKIYENVGQFIQDYNNLKITTVRTWLEGNIGTPQEFIELGLCYIGEENNIKPRTSSKKVICDGFIYNTIKSCSLVYDIKSPTMAAWLKGRNNMPQKFKDMGLRYYIEAEDKEKIAV